MNNETIIEFSFISMTDSDLEIRAGVGRSSRAFRSPAWFRRTRKRLCVNQVRSLLSMRCMLLGYSFEPTTNSRALSTAGSVMLRDLSIKRCSHSKKKVWQKNKKIEQSRSSGCGNFKGLRWFRQHLLFSSSLKKTKRGFVRRVYMA